MHSLYLMGGGFIAGFMCACFGAYSFGNAVTAEILKLRTDLSIALSDLAKKV